MLFLITIRRAIELDLLEDTIVNIPISFKHKIDEAMGK